MSEAVRQWAREIGVGRALMKLYYAPVGQVAKSIREGGPWEQRRTEAGRIAMVEAAKDLAPLAMPTTDRGFRTTFLSGEAYWYQTLFCVYSLQVTLEERVTPVIFDDGTLSSEATQHILRAVPWARFVSAAEVSERLDRSLPVARFPSLRSRRIEYPHLRKLTDLHVEAPGMTLVLDSDMLFFRRPDALLAWWGTENTPCHMQDIVSSYGYSAGLMSELARGAPLPAAVNVGLYSLHGPSIDWDRIEFDCRVQIEREGRNYLQEQALTALALSGTGAVAFPRSDYVVLPSLEEGASPTAVLHHYVAHSKRAYFQFGWRRVLGG